MNPIDPRTTQQGLAFIVEHIEGMGYPPTTQQVADHCGLNSKAAGMRVMNRLVDEGLIERDHGVVRGMRVTKAGMKARTIPL